MPRVKWLDKTLLLGPCLTLCTSEDEFAAVLKHLKIGERVSWLSPFAQAETHTFDHEEEPPVAAVCMRPGMDTSNAALTLSHEALHVFRRWMEFIGEDKPGEEIEAYCIKNIAVTLTTEYEHRRA